MILNSPTISGSLTVTGNILISGSITLSGSIASASYAATSSFVALAQSASNAVAAATASSADNLLVRNTLTAQTLVVQTITSSVDFVTGSTRFGSLLANTHVFSGSVTMNPNGLFVSGSGLVGIGTSNPTYSLDLNASSYKTFRIQANDDVVMTFGSTIASSQYWSVTATANGSGQGSNVFFIGRSTNNPSGLLTKDFTLSSTGAATFSNSVTLPGNLFWNAGDGVNWYIQGQANGPTIRMKYHGGSTDRSGALGWIDNSGGRYDALTWQDQSVTFGGIVTKPYQPAFRAGRSSSVTPGAGATIVFNTTSGFGFNVGGHYNTSNGRFTAPVTGIYNFNTCVIWESLGSGQAMDDAFEIKVNGSTCSYSFRRAAYVANNTGIGGYYTDHATVLLNLTAGQYVEVVNRYAGLSVHGNQNYCYFTGYLVG
jgi:hypothetical protein